MEVLFFSHTLLVVTQVFSANATMCRNSKKKKSCTAHEKMKKKTFKSTDQNGLVYPDN